MDPRSDQVRWNMEALRRTPGVFRWTLQGTKWILEVETMCFYSMYIKFFAVWRLLCLPSYSPEGWRARLPVRVRSLCRFCFEVLSQLCRSCVAALSKFGRNLVGSWSKFCRRVVAVFPKFCGNFVVFEYVVEVLSEAMQISIF